MSERRAVRVLGAHRSGIRYRPKRSLLDAPIRERMEEIAGEMKAEPYGLLRSPREEADRALAQEKRRQRIQQIRDLRESESSRSAIVRQLWVSLAFVRRSISLDALPERRYRKR